ncbi:RNA polymerase sigma-70 factor, ECF subfamily [Chitinophaga jiangningensis]|uniref:RNA polymerase sigma-70 factor, ECF subfamily n=1 Tax=Chitinophaga jiangningensis TaxID=1419482 RepID=A0A1M7G302_9BACT|nr:sigma-70 family RNA polymerase sigma factor [Chitinophaga jiangningensis]SHM10651.1 RNA polymerase sigma-70 factor, ECF subfamily [Chitinophaga jiangningensis]
MVESVTYLLNRIAYLRDEKAYQSIFLHFHPRLFRFCFSVLKDAEASEEIVSDILLKVWTMDHRLNFIEDIELYLFRAAKNACFTWISQQKRKATTALEDFDTADTNSSAENVYIRNETKREIEYAISTLPQQCQLVFRLAKEEGFSYKRIGAVLDISQNTIESHMRTALKRIRLQLQKYLEGRK